MRIALDISTAIPTRTGVGHTTYELAARLPFVAPHPEFLYLFHSLRQPLPRFALFSHRRVKIIRRRIPGPVLLLSWQHLRYPTADTLARGAELYHAAGMFVPPRRRMPIVTTVHDLFFLDRPDMADGAPWGDAYLARTLGERLQSSAAIICPSHKTAAQVNRHFGDKISNLERRLSVVPWGVGPRWFLPAYASDRDVLSRLGIGGPYILSIISSSLRKNVSQLINAFLILIRDYRINLQLVCVGMAACQVQSFMAQPLHGVRFISYLSRHELAILTRNAHLFVSASLMEGFGVPILEAMAAGVPVVTTPQAGVLDFTDPGSTAVTEDVTAPALASSMAQVLHDSTLRTTLVRSGRKAAAALTWRRTARETFAVYEKAIKTQCG